MKKLMIALAAAATTMFSFGDLPTGTSFEALTEGPVTVGNIAKTDDTGNQDGADKYWSSTAPEADELGAITNDVAGQGVSRPDMFLNSTQSKSLFIDTSAPLVRAALPSSSESQSVAIGDGIYLDTLVKFTAADEAFAENLTEGDKIAIEYVEHEAEGDDVGYTNFVIRAGFVGGSEIVQTNYFAAVPDGFNKDAWHRLTVRTIADVGDGHVGFVIYLDGNIDKTLEYSTDVDAGFNTASLTPGAAKFYSGEKHALFPSAVEALATGGSTISSVAFSGNGFIDDVSFAAEAPNFIKAGEAVPVAITLGTGVTGVTVTVGENAYNPVDATATPLVFNLPAGTTSFDLAVTADTDNGYTFDGATGITAEYASYNNGTVTISGAAPALTVVGTRNNVTYIDGNNQQQGSPSLATAIAGAKAGSTITLAYPINVVDVEGGEFTTYTVSKDITIDLNGTTITWDDVDAETSLFTITSSGSLKVIDSSVANTGAIVYAGVEGCVFYNSGDCYIGATSGDYGPTVQGTLTSKNKEPTIVRGKFDKAKNTASSAFKWADSIGEGSELKESLGDYWVVEPAGGVIGTYAVTVTPTANATYAAAYKVGGETITPANDVLTVTVGQTIVITATPAANYEYATTPDGWTAGQDGEITIEVSEAGTVAIPAPTEKVLGTYTVTVIPTNNTTYAAAYKVGGETITPANDVLTVTVGQTIVITATPAANYEYATTPDGWTAGQDGEITIEVSEAGTVAIPGPTEKGGKTYPSYIDDTEKTKYDTWAAYAEISAADFPDATGSNEEAYLLNCKPSEVADAKAAFKFTSISYDTTQSKWVTATTTSYNERGYNGEVVVKQYSDVGCTTESSTGTFFKAFLQ